MVFLGGLDGSHKALKMYSGKVQVFNPLAILMHVGPPTV